MSIKLVARRFEDFEGFVLFKTMQFSQSESTRVTWFELTTDPCPKHSQTIACGVSLYSPDLSCICWILLCNIRVSLSTLAFHVGVGRLADWNSVASNIYYIYIFLMEAWPCQPNIPPPWTSSVWLDRPCTERCALARLDVRLTLNCGASQTSLVAVMFYLQAYLSHLLLM